MRACLVLALIAASASAQPNAAWAPVGTDPAAQPVIAATSRKVGAVTTIDARLPPPDDGLCPPLAATPQTPRRLPTDLMPSPPPTIQPVAAALPTAVGLAIEARAPDRVFQGQPLPCELTVRNGSTAVTSARVELPLPADVRVVTTDPPAQRVQGALVWDLGTIPASAERVLRAELLAGADEEVQLRPVVAYAPAAPVRTLIVRPPVGLTVVGPESATVGDALTFRITLRNNTPSTLRKVALTCRLPDGALHAQGAIVVADIPGDVPPGQERTEEVTVRAASGGSKAIAVDARADGGLSAQARAVVDVKEPVVSLQVQGPRRAKVGEEFTLRLLIANPGRSPTPPLRAFLPIPDGVEVVSAGDGGGLHPAGGCLYWPVGALSAEGHTAVTATLRGRIGGDWGLSGVVSGDGVKEVRHTQAVMVEHVPNLTMDLSRLDDPLPLGGETTYSVRVYNPGPAAALGVQPHFELPEHLLAVEADGPARWEIRGSRVLFEPVPSMPPRTDATYTVRVRAARPGMGAFRAAVIAVGLGPALSREVTARTR